MFYRMVLKTNRAKMEEDRSLILKFLLSLYLKSDTAIWWYLQATVSWVINADSLTTERRSFVKLDWLVEMLISFLLSVAES